MDNRENDHAGGIIRWTSPCVCGYSTPSAMFRVPLVTIRLDYRLAPVAFDRFMKIILAAPRGFCAGVHMAIDSLSLTLQKFGPPVYVYHEIVHNQFVVNEFQGKGAVFVNAVDEVPRGSVLMFSAHGVSPEIRQAAKERELFAIDATCPLVTKVHLEAIKYAKAGYTIILIGHEGHDEVLGTMGEAPEAIVLVEDEADVDALQFPEGTRLAYLTQTTLSVDDANRVISRLRSRFPEIESPPKEDICYATQNRQEAVRKLSDEADVVVILGSQNSSNSQRLRELAAEKGQRAFLVDGPQDLSEEQFQLDDTVLISAGASAPESVVQSVIEWLQQRFDASVEPREIRKEDVRFPLPKPLREYAKEAKAGEDRLANH
ncbi:hydroxymethylbutenyl pyrophosphate reductase [Rhodopirellula sallentina SM41]|uniref:4-hydroxy-3-methylbut-2-enyl diphosphate reductase n=2 Tax=Rhodopirellula TaxID=265488 RepID=M5TT05_9BACT|nr:hydroxymethylbutenyl pyrophosphate reductase [Rhodopirellula sallentina SM41]